MATRPRLRSRCHCRCRSQCHSAWSPSSPGHGLCQGGGAVLARAASTEIERRRRHRRQRASSWRRFRFPQIKLAMRLSQVRKMANYELMGYCYLTGAHLLWHSRRSNATPARPVARHPEPAPESSAAHPGSNGHGGGPRHASARPKARAARQPRGVRARGSGLLPLGRRGAVLPRGGALLGLQG